WCRRRIYDHGRAVTQQPEAGCRSTDCRAAEETASVDADHWIHWVTCAAMSGGMLRPSACAVLTLTARSYFVGSSTGRSEGLAPLRILSTKPAARRETARISAP